MLKKINKNIMRSLAVAALLYLGFIIYADFDNVLNAFSAFNWVIFPLLLMLSFLNYVVRFIKWDYYLKILGVEISKLDSFAIFMSGLIMSVTPGKMGELLKSYLVKEVTKEPIHRTAPIVFVERITDFISLVLLAVVGAYVFNYGRIVVVGTGLFFLLVTILICNKRLSLRIISFFARIRILKKYVSKIESAYESAYILLRPLPLFYMIGVSLVSWSFECFGYYIILANFHINADLLWATFVYTFSTIAGAITMLPGGLGITDGSLTLLLIQRNVPKNLAVSSTFIIRVVTLWFAVFVGMISVSFYQKRFGKIEVESISKI